MKIFSFSPKKWVKFDKKDADFKVLKNVSVVFASILLTLALVEFVAFMLNRHEGNLKKESHFLSENLFWLDKNLGVRTGKPNAAGRESFSFRGKTEFDVEYHLDEFGRRRSKVKASTPALAAHIFTGCSFTFGVGVGDDEAFPAIFQELDHGVRSYNYAVPGYGPHDVLGLLQGRDLRKEITEKRVLFHYVWLDFHYRRAIGSMDYSRWGSSSPYFKDNIGGIQRAGNFESGRPFLAALFSFLSKSNFLSWVGADFPLRVSESDAQLTASIIKGMEQRFMDQFPGGSFDVILFPAFRDNNTPPILPLLVNENIKVIDLNKIGDERMPCTDGYFCDNHPKPMTHRIVAERLYNFVN